jgi:hypothetical protein
MCGMQKSMIGWVTSVRTNPPLVILSRAKNQSPWHRVWGSWDVREVGCQLGLF